MDGHGLKKMSATQSVNGVGWKIGRQLKRTGDAVWQSAGGLGGGIKAVDKTLLHHEDGYGCLKELINKRK